ncbi:DciA family protein [Candidatus Venteria ishoeyi]|nr:DciA family protein [Candidatus Venteria ishoeyi]MDM8546619.1 DciA family protein [Candidatus Venteria ishoeyi]
MQNISNLFQHQSRLQALLNQSRYLRKLDIYLQQCLPAPLNAHVWLANVRQGTLYLHADAPVWGSRLRMFGPQLLQCWQRDQRLPQVSTLRIKVRQPPQNLNKDIPFTPHILSESAAEILHTQAEYTEYLPLREALLRLSGKEGEM